MTDLLPVLFSRGQNEGIDPRVAPADVHRVAQNVRWRKDGRPGKRFGLTALTTTGLDTGGTLYTTQAVNAIDSWNDAPLLILGAGVRQFVNGAWYPSPQVASTSDISHWGPGERLPIARTEASASYNHPSVGATPGLTNGLVLYAWDDGSNIYTAIYSVGGALIQPPTALVGGTFPRVIVCTGFFYVLYKSGVNLKVLSVDFSSLAYTFVAAVQGTLSAVGDHFDGFGRGSTYVIAYQSAAAVITSKVWNATATPGFLRSNNHAMFAANQPYIAITSTATSSVFIAWIELSSGNVIWTTANNAMTAILSGPTSIAAADIHLQEPPGLVTTDDHTAALFYGGAVNLGGINILNYFSLVPVNDAGGVAGTLQYTQSAGLASKPFMGPATGTIGMQDGIYIWVRQDQASTFDDQRAYTLLRFDRFSGLAVTRQMRVPNLANPIRNTNSPIEQLTDVVNAGFEQGHFTCLLNAVRFTSGVAPECLGIDSVSFHSIFESPRYAARDTATVGRALQIAGGSLYEFNGFSEETDFSAFPVIISASAVAGGSLSVGTYLYRVVFEYIDEQGRRHRSSPSDPATVTTAGANLTGSLSVFALVCQSRATSAVMHVYRTLVGQSTYHRVTPSTGAPTAFSGGSVLAYNDTASDASVAGNEFIYTDGGVVPNDPAPPSTFMAVCNGRLWLGGQFDRCVITASKIVVDGEPVQFSEEDEFSVFLPRKCTGLASIDGTVVAFARERIYLVSGDGPSDQGIGSFSPPAELPTDVGCVDWRSIVETSLGIFFQSKRGIYLLPRGFNAPIFIGAGVEDTLAAFPVVHSATLVSVPSNSSVSSLGEITVRFVVTDAGSLASRVLVYDMRTGGWSVDRALGSNNTYGLCGTWADTFVVTKTAGTGSGAFNGIQFEDATTYAEDSLFIRSQLGTGDVRPFGIAGYGQIERVLIMGEYRGDCVLTAQVSVDGVTADSFVFSLVGAPAESNDNSVYLDVTPRVQKGSAVRVTLTDSAVGGAGGTPTEGFIMQALFIETELIGKTKRLPAGRKA